MISADDIRGRFRKNLMRVRHLLDVFRMLHQGPGRPTELKADVVRAAVIFLHATMEDLLRSGEQLRFSQAPAKAFERIRWVPPGTQSEDYERLSEKLTLVELAECRGQTVDEVLLRAREMHLERSNYNNERDVVGALQRMGLDKAQYEQFFPDLQAMMKRRHWIAHRADAHKKVSRLTNPISVKLAEGWLQVVESFGERLLMSL